MAEAHAPVPDVRVDPSADRVWAADFAKGNVTLTVTRGAATAYTKVVATTNVLTRGSWNLDMWVQRTGTLPRPTMALYDLKAVFDIKAGDTITVTDGASTRSIPVANLTVDSVDATTDVISGHATETVSLHLGDAEGGYWGYQADPVAGLWSYRFEPGVFPNPPGGLEPGTSGQAIIYPGTVVRWTVPTTPTQPKQLIASVKALHLKAGLERGLIATLNVAQTAYDRHRDKVGNLAMAAFTVEVRALSPKFIAAAAAKQLIADAKAVMKAHGG